MSEKVKLCHTEGIEGHEPPHPLKSSERSRMISDFPIQRGKSKLSM